MTVGRTSSDHRRLGLQSGGSRISRRSRLRGGHRGAGLCDFLFFIIARHYSRTQSVTTYVCPTVVTIICIFWTCSFAFLDRSASCWICTFFCIAILNGRDCLGVCCFRRHDLSACVGKRQKQNKSRRNSLLTARFALDTHHLYRKSGYVEVCFGLLDHSSRAWRF
jgi:hypothetical protein